MKRWIKILLIAMSIVVLFVVAYNIARFLLFDWWYLFQPSQGTWQYKDDDLEITIYVPGDGGINTPAGFNKCKTEILYKGKKQKAITSYHTKMYSINMVPVDDYTDILKSGIEYGYGSIMDSPYLTPMKKNEWEFRNIETHGKILSEYEGKNLIFKKIGDYKYQE